MRACGLRHPPPEGPCSRRLADRIAPPVRPRAKPPCERSNELKKQGIVWHGVISKSLAHVAVDIYVRHVKLRFLIEQQQLVFENWFEGQDKAFQLLLN